MNQKIASELVKVAESLVAVIDPMRGMYIGFDEKEDAAAFVNALAKTPWGKSKVDNPYLVFAYPSSFSDVGNIHGLIEKHNGEYNRNRKAR